MSEKSFSNFRHNGIHLRFPNGNWLSTIWGAGSYSENHYPLNDDSFRKFMQSNTVEVMLECSPRLKQRLHRKFDGDGAVIGHLNIADWLYIVNALAGEIKEATNE